MVMTVTNQDETQAITGPYIGHEIATFTIKIFKKKKKIDRVSVVIVRQIVLHETKHEITKALRFSLNCQTANLLEFYETPEIGT